MAEASKTHFTVRFTITNEELFKPFRKKLCQAMDPASEEIDGAYVSAVSADNEFEHEDHANYLAHCIEAGTDADEALLDFEDWRDNGRPPQHVPERKRGHGKKG